MVFKELNEIVKLICNPKNGDAIAYSRNNSKQHQRHISGKFLSEYLKQQAGFETDAEYSLRKENTQPYTKAIMEGVMKPFDKIFSARGGSRNIDISDNLRLDFAKKLNNVARGLSMREYMQTIWKPLVNIDCFGLLMVNSFLNEFGEKDSKVVYKSSFDLLDIGYSSFQKIEYIIFEPIELKVGEKKYLLYRVFDDNYDTMILFHGNDKTKLESYTAIEVGESFHGYKSFENVFTLNTETTVVPAIFISQRANAYDLKVNDTWISEAIPYANDFITDKLNNNLYKLKQGFPYVWEYATACPMCKGEGTIDVDKTCPKCDGTGVNPNRRISDRYIVPVPEEGDQTITPPAGYIQPDLETWKKQEETLDRLKKDIVESVWGNGTSVNNLTGKATATEVIVKAEPQMDRLELISNNAEIVENFITNLLGFYYYGNSFKGANIQYGKRYDVKSTTELWNEYLSSKEKDVDTFLLNELLAEYYYSLYKNAPEQLEKSVKALKVKPFFHLSIEQLNNIREFVVQSDYLGNLYFDSFWNSITPEERKNKTTEQLKEMLKTFIVQNIINNLKPVENGTT